ncbi:hypothetical protein NNX28_03285 [Arthrobacter sp. zg-Y859]|uniref:Uncharacterized protein n=1 Tax=Arthrobacter jinronghuae TaxID=2964609 RepID=A0ABT1NMK2_9MICC|nr:hypothetical protein [Arthrobacter jinronghuae]MCQ1948952.1 hypothetical protein [Arthrobacter jinronghuae]UWX78245.1 hypothetical protein N2K98_14980 [Arthrobacter jinronghuae]
MKNLPLSLALAASVGAFTLSRPADWSPGLRRAYVLGSGAAAGAVVVLALRKGRRKGRELAAAGTVDLVTPFTAGAGGDSATVPSYVAAPTAGSRTRMPEIALTGMAALMGATVSGITALTLVLDEAVETWLVRRGVARPRRVMAMAAALYSLVIDRVMDSQDAKDSKPSQ